MLIKNSYSYMFVIVDHITMTTTFLCHHRRHNSQVMTWKVTCSHHVMTWEVTCSHDPEQLQWDIKW